MQRVRHLRRHNAPPTTPVGTFYIQKADGSFRARTVTSDAITTTLRFSLSALGPATLGIKKLDISARSLRASGAMALLCAHVDHDTIRLIGRWRSDEMLRYLHVQACPIMHDFARRMVDGANYTMLPNNTIPNNPQIPV